MAGSAASSPLLSNLSMWFQPLPRPLSLKEVLNLLDAVHTLGYSVYRVRNIDKLKIHGSCLKTAVLAACSAAVSPSLRLSSSMGCIYAPPRFGERVSMAYVVLVESGSERKEEGLEEEGKAVECPSSCHRLFLSKAGVKGSGQLRVEFKSAEEGRREAVVKVDRYTPLKSSSV